MISVTPLVRQVSNSLAFIWRLALAMSGVLAPIPEQNSWMPPPVPVASINGEPNSGCARAKVSDTALAKG
jgi:hypothetical protein